MIRQAHAQLFTLLASALLVSGCAAVREGKPHHAGLRLPTPFSLVGSVDGVPAGWETYRLLRFKPLTKFSVVADGGATVVRAQANSSVSGLRQSVSVDLAEFPFATWRWKVPRLIEDADNTVPGFADAPARVVFTFEGSRDQLPDTEQLNFDLAKALTGNELPYATLMYIWEPNRTEGDVITHYNTTRVKMIVAGNSSRNLDAWHEVRVNLLADYRRAFDEPAPRVKTVGIMSDSDNTRTSVEAFFGDIRFLRD